MVTRHYCPIFNTIPTRICISEGGIAKTLLGFFGLVVNRPLLACSAFYDLYPTEALFCQSMFRMKVVHLSQDLGNQYISQFMSVFESTILSGLLVDFLFAQKSQMANLSLSVSFAFIFTMYYDSITIKKPFQKSRSLLLHTASVFCSTLLAALTITKVSLLILFDNFAHRLFIALYWLALLGLSAIFVEARLPKFALNSQRKFFHLLSIALFIPALHYDKDFLRLAMAVALNVFVAIEYYRKTYHLDFITKRLERNLKKQENKRGLIVAHMQLLLGCALPVWLCDEEECAMTGIISLGTGDAMASIVGMRFGRHRLFRGSKTAEGLIAFVGSCWIVRYVLGHSRRMFLADFLLGVLEVVLPSAANDSIILSVVGMIITGNK